MSKYNHLVIKKDVPGWHVDSLDVFSLDSRLILRLDWRRVEEVPPEIHHQVSEYYPGAFPYSFDFLYWEEVPSFSFSRI